MGYKGVVMSTSVSRRRFLARSATFGGLSVAAAAVPWARVALGSEGKAHDLFATINRAADPAKMTPLEAKHVPQVEAPEIVKQGEIFTLAITVGSTVHVMKPEHWISDVVLLTDQGTPVARGEMSPFVARPVAVFQLKPEEPLGFRGQESGNHRGRVAAVAESSVQ